MKVINFKSIAILLTFVAVVVTAEHGQRTADKSSFPRFVIPALDGQYTSLKSEGFSVPEKIHIVKKSGSLKGSALPGAFGEDDGLGDLLEESGSGSGSGSGDIVVKQQVKEEVHHDKTAENAANFGSNVMPKVGINPSSAFLTVEENHKGFKGQDASIEKKTKKKSKKSRPNKHKVLKKKENVSEKKKRKMEKVEKTEKTFKNVDFDDKEKAAVEKVIVQKEQNTLEKDNVEKNALEKDNVEKNALEKLSVNIAEKKNNSTGHKKIKSDTNKKLHAKTKITHKKKLKNVSDEERTKDTAIMTQIQNIAKQIDAVEKKKAKEEKNKKHKAGKTKVSSALDQLEQDITKYRLNKAASTENSHKNGKVESRQQLSNISKSSINGIIDQNDKLDKNESSEDIAISGFEEVPENESLQKTVVAQGEAGGPEGFECPWVCYWTCHSYCPKDCCNNPFKCYHQCKEFCTPYCKDRCCAPGARRLPKLALTFRSNAETGKKPSLQQVNQTALTEKERVKSHAENTEIISEIEALKQASTFAAQALGLPNSCPIFCPRICTPGLCRPECCNRDKLQVIPEVKLAPYISPAKPIPPPAAPAVTLPQQNKRPAPSPAAQQFPSSPLPAQAALAVKLPSPAFTKVTQNSNVIQAPPAPLPSLAQARPASLGTLPEKVTVQAPAALVTQTSQPSPPSNVVSLPAAPTTMQIQMEPSTVVPETPANEPASPEVKSFAAGQEVTSNQPEQSLSNEFSATGTGNVQEVVGPPITIQLPAPASTGEHAAIEQASAISPSSPASQTFFCPTPINCPEGGVVDPDYCPPICRTACIEQCPNECCPNSGRPLVQPK